jgi:hypothetical protein
VDLNPIGAVESVVYASSGAQQVGYTDFPTHPGDAIHASLWSSTAASWVDLNPSGAAYSYAYGVWGSQQVGVAYVGGVPRASLWSSTSSSWVDLHALLPSGFSSSTAKAIWTDGASIFVGGSGFNTLTNRNEALLWSYQVPAPSAGAVIALGGLIASRRRR